MFMQKSKFLVITGLLLVIIAVLTGCSRKSSDGSSGDSYAEQSNSSVYNESAKVSGVIWEGQGFGDPAAIPEEPEAVLQRDSQQTIQIESTAMPVKRKLIKQADLRIEADSSFIGSEGELFGVNQKVDELMKRYGAYSESTRSDEDTVHFTIRVPDVFYESLIAGISVLGKVQSRTETAEDVTIKYYDLEGRLNTKKTLLSTFQGYLSRTTSIDDIMKVETRINELQNEIDWLGNQLTRLGNLVDYATVELTVYTHYDTPSFTFRDRVKQLFGGFRSFASGAALVILGILVYAVPVIIICFAVFWLLFGRLGLLKKAFRYITYNDKTKKKMINKSQTAQEGKGNNEY